MTPEERLTKIENAIQALVDVQAKHDEGIGQLIEISRRLVDAQIVTDGQIRELREAQKHADERLNALQEHTDERLNALIETVDRIIRREEQQ